MDWREKTACTSGFTLIELMLTLIISAIIIAAIYSAYLSQSRVYNAQEAVAEMQQNIRAGLGILTRDIRMAGYDPSETAGAGFVDGTAFSNGGGLSETVNTSASQIAFTVDLDGDGLIDEAAEDLDGNGNQDMTEIEQIAYRLGGTNSTDLQRYSTTTGIIEWQTVAEGIENLEFRYLDSSGNVTANLNAMKTVQISLLARSAQLDRKFTNTMTYVSAGGVNWGPYGDNLRRRLLITRVDCRNMGL